MNNRPLNIIYINHYAGSPEMGMEFRPYYLSEEWVKMGHKVTVVAGDYSHLRIKNPSVVSDFQEEDIDGITYSWVKTGSYEGNGAARAMTMFRFVYKLRRHAREIAEQKEPDVIITSSTYPLDTYAGQKIRRYSKQKYGKRAVLIHEVHDMWPITLIELGGMKKSNPFVVLMQIAENSFCRNSDYVVSLLCAAKDYFISHGMKADKFRNVMNGIVLDEWNDPLPLPEEHQNLLTDLKKQGKFVICFFGSITKSYAIEHLIEAVKQNNDPSVAVVIVGEGNQKDELISKSVGQDNVYFLPKISKRAVPTLLDNIDCCYVGALKNDMFRFGICMNKLFDSMMSGKPLLYAVEAPNNFAGEYSCGVSVEAENVKALAEGINALLAMTPAERKRMGENGRNAVLQHFTYEKLAKQFESIFKEGIDQ